MNETVIKFLNGRRSASEAAAITRYSVYFGGRDVRVNVMDHGADAGDLRYSAEAYYAELSFEARMDGEPGYSAGNPDRDVRGALMNVHWNVFENGR